MPEIVSPCPSAVKLRQTPRTTHHCSERPSSPRSRRRRDPALTAQLERHPVADARSRTTGLAEGGAADTIAAVCAPRTDLAVDVLISDLVTTVPSDCLLPIETLMSAGRSFATFCVQSRGHFDPAEHLEVHLLEAWDQSLTLPDGERAVLLDAVGWLAVAFLRGDHGRSQVVPIPKAVMP